MAAPPHSEFTGGICDCGVSHLPLLFILRCTTSSRLVVLSESW